VGTVLLGLCTPLCWGTWMVPMRYARTICSWGCASFAIFYYWFAFGICLTLMTLATVLEYTGGRDFTSLFDVSLRRLVASISAGVMWQVGNLLLALTVQLAGPGFAMCCCSSVAMTFGTGLTHLVAPQGNLEWLAAGVVLAIGAAGTIFQMHSVKDRALKEYRLQKNAEERLVVVSLCAGDASPVSVWSPARSTAPLRAGRGLVFTVGGGSGLGIALFGPLNTLALAGNADVINLMGPVPSINSTMFWFGLGVLVGVQVSLPITRWLLPRQFEEQHMPEELVFAALKVPYWKKVKKEAGEASIAAICASVSAGALWSFGLYTNFQFGTADGWALAYALSQCCPLPAILWGVIIFHEFSGEWVPRKAKILLLVDVLLYFGAVGCFVACKLSSKATG